MIGADSSTMTKDVRSDHHLPHSMRELDRCGAVFHSKSAGTDFYMSVLSFDTSAMNLSNAGALTSLRLISAASKRSLFRCYPKANTNLCWPANMDHNRQYDDERRDCHFYCILSRAPAGTNLVSLGALRSQLFSADGKTSQLNK